MHGYGVNEDAGYGGGTGAYSFQYKSNPGNGRGCGRGGQFSARGSQSLGFGGVGDMGQGFSHGDDGGLGKFGGVCSGFGGRGGGRRGKSFGQQGEFCGKRGGKGFVAGNNFGGNEDYEESGNGFDNKYIQWKVSGFGGGVGFGQGGGGFRGKNIKGPRGGFTGANNCDVGGGRGNSGFGFGNKQGQRGGLAGARGGGGWGQNQGRGRGRSNLSGVMGTQQAKKRPLSVSPSRWATMYDAPLPTILTSMCTLVKCGLCDVPFNGPATSKSHYDGKAHEKKVVQYLADNVSDEESRPKKVKMSTIATPTVVEANSDLSCSLCNLVCTSTVVYDSHMQGKNHAIKVRAASSVKGGELRCGVCNIYVTSQEALTNHLAGKQHKRKSERMKDIQGGVQLHCALCGVKSTDRPGIEAHLKGKRHLEKLEGEKKKDAEKDELDDITTKNDVKKEKDLTGETKNNVSVKVIDYNTYDFKSFGGKEETKVEDVTK